MSNDQVVREQLLFLLDGGNAHMSFDQVVANFPMEAINNHPKNIDYTPWHLLEHIRIAQWDILEFSRDPGHVSPEWPVGYWPDPGARADGAQWEATIISFRRDLKALQEMARDPNTDLYSDLPHAPGYNILREVLLVADHNAYHIGELAILRQVMGLWPSGSA